MHTSVCFLLPVTDIVDMMLGVKQTMKENLKMVAEMLP